MNKIGIFGFIICAGISITAIVGWVINVVSIVHTIDLPLTGMFVLRCVGVVVAPLGAILGLFF